MNVFDKKQLSREKARERSILRDKVKRRVELMEKSKKIDLDKVMSDVKKQLDQYAGEQELLRKEVETQVDVVDVPYENVFNVPLQTLKYAGIGGLGLLLGGLFTGIVVKELE
jgi:hypothetical protein